MTEFNPEYVSSEDARTNRLEHHARSRVTDHEIFSDARIFYESFSDDRLTGDELATYWKAKLDQLDTLNEGLKRSNLINRTVTIEGHEVTIPEAYMTMSANITTVADANKDAQTKISLESNFNPVAYKNKFKGFGIVPRKIPEEDDLYALSLAYMVDAGEFRSPNASFSLFASGDIETTTINFEEDVKLDEIDRLSDSILLLRPAAAETLNRIRGALSLSPTRLNSDVIRSVAENSKEIAEMVEDESFRIVWEDLIADLVHQYLDNEYDMSSHVYLKTKNGENAKTTFIDVESPYKFVSAIKDVAFMDQIDFPGEPKESQGKRALHFVFTREDTEESLYVPVHTVTAFKKK